MKPWPLLLTLGIALFTVVVFGATSFAGAPAEPDGASDAVKETGTWPVLVLFLFWPSFAVLAGLAMRRGCNSRNWNYIGKLLLSIAVFWWPIIMALVMASAYRNAPNESSRISYGWVMYYWATYFAVLSLALVLVIPKYFMRNGSPASTAGDTPPKSGPTSTEPPPRTSGLAIASTVCGCTGFILMGLPAIAGMVLGILALRSIRRSEGQLRGHELAVVGIALSASCILMYIFLLSVIPAVLIYFANLIACRFLLVA